MFQRVKLAEARRTQSKDCSRNKTTGCGKEQGFDQAFESRMGLKRKDMRDGTVEDLEKLRPRVKEFRENVLCNLV